MKNIALLIIVNIFCFTSYCQNSGTPGMDSALEKEKYWQNWIKDLYEVGVEQTADSFKISAEVKKIILDTNYKKTFFPANYSLQNVAELYKKMEIKKAMWYLINIYNTNQNQQTKNDLLRLILPFEKGLEMDKVLISTFYTYALIDPTIGNFTNGRIQILRPDLLEAKFNVVKEIIGYVVNQRTNPNINASKVIGTVRSKELEDLGKGNVRK